MKDLRAKHADELHVLEAKQAELETLDALLDRFADDLQGTPQTGAERHALAQSLLKVG